jgi:hypothetical protein
VILRPCESVSCGLAGSATPREHRSERRQPAGVDGRPAARRAARDGDVRPRRGHVADERVDLGRRARPRHDRQRRPIRDRARGARLGGVHPDRQQDRRPDRAQARIRARPPRLRHRCRVDDACAEPAADRHLLGHRRRPWSIAPAPLDAVPDPRQLRGTDAAEGVRAGGRRSRDRRRRRPLAGRIRDDLPVVAGRLPRRGRDHRDRALRHQARPRRPVHGVEGRRRRRRDPLGGRHGRGRAGDPRVGGGRRGSRRAHGPRGTRARLARLVAQTPQARREAGAAGRRPLCIEVLPARDLRSDAPADRPRRNE